MEKLKLQMSRGFMMQPQSLSCSSETLFKALSFGAKWDVQEVMKAIAKAREGKMI